MTRPARRPRLALALGGGGARGLAHIGVLQVLEQEGLAPGFIAGSSMGGLVGALCASGLLSQDLIEITRNFRLPRWFLPGGLLGWEQIFPSAAGAIPATGYGGSTPGIGAPTGIPPTSVRGNIRGAQPPPRSGVFDGDPPDAGSGDGHPRRNSILLLLGQLLRSFPALPGPISRLDEARLRAAAPPLTTDRACRTLPSRMAAPWTGPRRSISARRPCPPCYAGRTPVTGAVDLTR